MKRLIIVGLTVLLSSFGLVATSGGTASADPYPGTVKTKCRVLAKSPVQRGRHGVGSAFVSTSGNARPVGRIVIVVKRARGGAYFRQKSSYEGRTVPFVTQKLRKPGLYTVRVSFHAKGGTVYQDCRNVASFRVNRPR